METHLHDLPLLIKPADPPKINRPAAHRLVPEEAPEATGEREGAAEEGAVPRLIGRLGGRVGGSVGRSRGWCGELCTGGERQSPDVADARATHHVLRVLLAVRTRSRCWDPGAGELIRLAARRASQGMQTGPHDTPPPESSPIEPQTLNPPSMLVLNPARTTFASLNRSLSISTSPIGGRLSAWTKAKSSPRAAAAPAFICAARPRRGLVKTRAPARAASLGVLRVRVRVRWGLFGCGAGGVACGTAAAARDSYVVPFHVNKQHVTHPSVLPPSTTMISQAAGSSCCRALTVASIPLASLKTWPR
jgi:hypothetical protein